MQEELKQARKAFDTDEEKLASIDWTKKVTTLGFNLWEIEL